MSKNRRSLKNLLLNPRFQMKYVGLTAGAALLLAAANATVFYAFTKENYAILVDLAPMTDEVKTQLYAELRHIMLMIALTSVGFIACVSGMMLYLSHRTAGPLYHFNRIFNDVRSGRTQARVRLRPNDDFQDVARSFNQMMDSICPPPESATDKKN